MSGEIEAAGDVLTGGAVARAVEPDHGEAAQAGHGDCLNCGTRLLGSHCHSCGQASHVHRSLAALWHDLAHGVFHFEGKVWRTLPMLTWRPGDLTRRYIGGERARFVSPLALFLFLVFAMFAIVTSVSGDLADPGVAGRIPNMPVVEIDGDIKKLEAERKTIEDQRARSGDAVLMAERHTELVEEVAELKQARGMLSGQRTPVDGVSTGWKPLDKAIQKANANPGLLLYKLQSNAYKYAWALIPLSVPFVWLCFFWYRGLHFYDHAIFVTYSLCFMMLLVIVLTIADAIGAPEGLIATVGTFVPPIHLYRQLRGAYRCSVAGALLRTFILVTIGGIVLVLFLMLLLGLGMMG